MLRRLFAPQESAPPQPPTDSQQIPTAIEPVRRDLTPQPIEDSSFFSRRAARQFGLYLAGAGFFILSTSITRRAMIRRNKVLTPPLFHPSNKPHGEVNGAMEALDALTLATLNVGSFGMMLGGGAAWAFNVSSLDELRYKLRSSIGLDSNGESKEAEEEMEEWIAEVLGRKEEKEQKGEKPGMEGAIVGLLQSLAKKEEKNGDNSDARK